MKKTTTFLIAVVILFNFSCSNGNGNSMPEAKNSSSTYEIKNSENHAAGDGITGEWQLVGSGFDDNHNGILDDAEMKINDPLPGGFDYFHFYENNKCIYDKKIQFDGTYTIKKSNDRNAIFIYPGGLPPGLSDEERDSNAFIFRIDLIEKNKMVLKPAHLQGKFVVYKRI